MGGGGPVPSPPAAKLTPGEAQRNQQTEEILDSVLPPREWSEEGQLCVQRVSSTPATRLDVVNLQVGRPHRLHWVSKGSLVSYRNNWTHSSSRDKLEKLASVLFVEICTLNVLVRMAHHMYWCVISGFLSSSNR